MTIEVEVSFKLRAMDEPMPIVISPKKRLSMAEFIKMIAVANPYLVLILREFFRQQ